MVTMKVCWAKRCNACTKLVCLHRLTKAHAYLQALKDVWQGGLHVAPVSGSIPDGGGAVVQHVRGQEQPGHLGGYGRLR